MKIEQQCEAENMIKKETARRFLDSLFRQTNMDDRIALVVNVFDEVEKTNIKSFRDFLMYLMDEESKYMQDVKLVRKICELDKYIKKD